MVYGPWSVVRRSLSIAYSEQRSPTGAEEIPTILDLVGKAWPSRVDQLGDILSKKYEILRSYPAS